MQDNQDENLCLDTCPQSGCPTDPRRKERSLCWSDSDCQRIETACGKENGNEYNCFMSNKGVMQICDKECLGGCAADDQGSCWACKNVLSASGRECYEICPSPFISVRQCPLSRFES